MLQFIAKKIYSILGPKICTKLAVNRLTLWFADKFFIGKHTFTGKYGIKLNFSAQEALVYGFPFLKVVNPIETSVIENLLTSYNIKTFVNVGVAEGWYIFLMKKLVPDIKIYGFEPAPDSFDKLSKNIRLNGLEANTDIVIENLAISDNVGTAEFWNSSSTSSLSKVNAELFYHSQKITVKTTTLDKYFGNISIEQPYMMMIDTEGAETLVIKGGHELFLKQPPLLLFVEVLDECLVNMNSSKTELLDLIKSYGYKPFIFVNGKITEYNAAGVESETANMLFIKG